MSKVVKSVTRAISKVVKGVASAVKKVATSKFGKLVLTAAAVYFGGAALMGGIGGATSAAAGSSFLGGAQAGLQSAWAGITSGSLSGAASGFTGAFNAGAAGTAGAAGAATAGLAAQPAAGAFTGATSTGLPTVAADTANVLASGGGAAGGAATTGLAEGMIGAAKISAGTQLVGGLIQGVGQQKAVEDQRAYEAQMAQQQRDRYNQNVGTNWWGGGDTGSTGATAPVYAQPAPTGLVANAMTPEQQYAERMRQQMLTYNPYALPTKI